MQWMEKPQFGNWTESESIEIKEKVFAEELFLQIRKEWRDNFSEEGVKNANAPFPSQSVYTEKSQLQSGSTAERRAKNWSNFRTICFFSEMNRPNPLYCSLARDWHFWHCLSFNFQIELNRARSTVRPRKSKFTWRQYWKSFGIFLNVAFGERGTSKAIFGALSYGVPWITPNKGEREKRVS